MILPAIVIAGLLFGVSGIIAAIFVSRRLSAKTRQLLADTAPAGAMVKCECIMRHGAMEYPGVAIVASNSLILHSVSGNNLEIPLADVALIKEGPGLGRYYLWGTRIFHLKTPGIRNLAIGVKDPEPWRKIFGQKMQAGKQSDTPLAGQAGK